MAVGVRSVAADLLKYGAASAAALALDYGTLFLLSQVIGVNYLISAAAGFSAGLALVYVLSVRFVYRNRRVMDAGKELAGFIVTGALGLLLNETLMALFVGVLGLAVAVAKIPTAGFVFLFNFATRRSFLFAAAQTDEDRRDNEAMP